MKTKHIILILFQLLLALNLGAQTLTKVTSTDLNFRVKASASSKVITTIPKGTQLRVNYSNQKFRSWTLIKYNGISGYVNSRYIVTPKASNTYHSTVTDKTNTYKAPSTTSQSAIRHYTNVDGNVIQSPTYYSSAPAGATARCVDGTYSFSQHRQGTCSHHGGVAKWL